MCKAGKNEAYDELLNLYSSRLFSYFYSLTGNREISSDLLSELFYRIVKNIKKCKADKFESWMYKIASNLFYDYLRNKQKEEIIHNSVKEQIADSSNSFNNKDDNRKWEWLLDTLDDLDDELRELIMLKYYSGLSFKEIASIKNKPIGTILAKVHRGIKKIKSKAKINMNL